MKRWLSEFWLDHKVRICFTLAVTIAIGVASYFGQYYKIVKITEQYKQDSVKIEDRAQAKIADTVQVKNREIKNLVSVMKEAPRQVRKIEKVDTLIVVKLPSLAKDSSRKDSIK
ncbi:hypothetical protein BWI97_15645 [Siphonobacter sp. BAB-5405]|uniref:hypothetical protein n=1 Tax=Siphonobacter sp. BAB-5405 TaxID=1864825 RepID=UPI000C809E46|nr:hypothetical protein [Siphonobacter sp. BAB-5405]PMD94830.1 hypothetical protein BWI97_15645 [Siphonobacter sp. BAB-5405]